MADDPTIRPGDSFNIATEGIGTGEPISVATRGFLEPDLTIANIIIGGDGEVTVTFNPPTTGGTTQTGGIAIIVVDLKTIYIYEASGGLVTGGEAYVQPNVEEATGGINVGGSADVTAPAQRSGMGAPRKRARHYTPHHYIWEPIKKNIVVSGEAESEFVTAKSAGTLFIMALDRIKIPVTRPTEPTFKPKPIIVKPIDFKRIFEEERTKPRNYYYPTKGKFTISGTAEAKFTSKIPSHILDEDNLLLSLPYSNSDYMVIETIYDTKLQAIRRDDDELIALLGE